jgi:uncharacterized protein (TIGR02301 family)
MRPAEQRANLSTMPQSSARPHNPLPLFLATPRLRAVLAAGLVLALGTAPAPAQFFQFPFGRRPEAPPVQARPKPRAAPKTPEVQSQPEAAPEVTTPYDPDLQRLAEILGALHFLRGICGYNEGQKWRDEAQALIDAEAPSGKRHDEMVESFNRGYLGFRQSYRSCTPAAKIVIRRYLQEGAQIARDITARYAD